MQKISLPVDLLRSETSLLKPVPIRKLRQRRFEQRTAIGSAAFFILKLLDATKFEFLNVFTLLYYRDDFSTTLCKTVVQK